MGRFKFAPYVFGAAAAFVLAVNPMDVQAAPAVTVNDDISFGDLDIQSKIIFTATEEVASPFYKKGISIADGCLMIRKEPNADSEVVGKLYGDAGFEVIEETSDWILIRSGECEGYVFSDYVVTGKDAEKLAENTDRVNSYAKIITDGTEIKAEASDEAQVIATVSANDVINVAAVIPETEWVKVDVNGAEGYVKNNAVEIGVDYTAALTIEEDAQRQAELNAQEDEEETETQEETAEETSAETVKESETTEETKETEPETEASQEDTYKEPEISIEDRWETVWAEETVNVRGKASTSGSVIGTLTQGSSVTRTGVCDNGWSRVDYNGKTGYIYSDYLTTTEPVSEKVNTESSAIGQQIVDYARKFLGNPYVYGGTSLTNGADCSGFVQSIFRDFGYSIPRTCTTQSKAGRAVSVDELQPGDIIIFAADGYEISHVAIYSGNGMTIHASNWDTGIIETTISYSGPIYCCRRIAE